MTLNKRLKSKIIEMYGVQADFAQSIGIHESDVSRVLRGRKQLTPKIQRLWASALKCKPDEIFEK